MLIMQEEEVVPGRVLLLDLVRTQWIRAAEQILQTVGYQTQQANDIETGLMLIRNYDLALICHPRIDAFDFLQQLQNSAVAKPVIFVAQESSEAFAIRAFRSGFSDYLTIDSSPEELLEILQKTLSHYVEQEIIARIPQQLLSSNLELTTYSQSLDNLVEVSKTLVNDSTLEIILQQVVDAAVAIMQAETASIFLLDPSNNHLYVRASRNFNEATAQTMRLPVDDSLAGQVIHTGQPIFITGEQVQKIQTLYLVKSLVYLPLRVGAKIGGVLGVHNRASNRQFTSQQIKLLNLLADFASIALTNAQLHVRTQKERSTLDAILVETEDIILITDDVGQILFCNPAARNLFKISPDYRGQANAVIPYEEIQDLLQADQVAASEVNIDENRVFNARSTIIPGVGRAIIMQNITHLKEIDRLKTNFVANVSQDLRSPLTAILGYVELLSRAGTVNSQQQLFIDRIALSAQTISNLITDLLDLSRIETSTTKINQETVGLRHIVRYALMTVEGQVKAKQQRMIVELNENTPAVCGNAQRLKQMVRNILQNAVQYTPEHGTIHVTLRPEGDLAVLQVQDTGIGIPIEDQPHIFEKFYRSDSVRNTHEGAGLGLAIVKSIVDQHGGRIWVESQPGTGSMFTVMLEGEPFKIVPGKIKTGELPTVAS
jgi:two-component system, OmpR family, phosphate regulon sensor histidine kinase PhoR